MEDDADLLNMDQNNQLGGMDQEQLTAEEKEEAIFKTLTTNNPQAPHNLTKFSYKDRLFKTEDLVEQMVIHFSFDGDILIKDCDEARDLEEFWDNKKRTNQGLLDKINVAIKEEFGKDPCKYSFPKSSAYKFKLIQWRAMTRLKRNPLGISSISKKDLVKLLTFL